MHAAPPVRMALAPDAGWRRFATLVASLAAANPVAWLLAGDDAPAGVAVVAMLLAAAIGAWAGRRWHAGVAGELAWDGASWAWTRGAAPAVAMQPRVMLDLGGWMLLRLAPLPRRPGGTIWTVASRRQAGLAWPQWRSALLAVAVAGPAAGAGGQGVA